MTVIHTSERTGAEIKLVHKQFFNLYDLVKQYRPGDTTPEALKYHDICVGVLNTGDVFIGESCPARVEEYKVEMAHQLSERDMMNQVYAARSFIIKTERSTYDPLPEAVYLEDQGVVTLIAPRDSYLYGLILNNYLQVEQKIPEVHVAIMVHPQAYTVFGYSQTPRYGRNSMRADACAALSAHVKFCNLTDHYRRFAELNK